MSLLKSPAIIPWILTLVLQATMLAEVRAVGPVGANCRYPVDGACAPKRGTYGYHQPNWRRMRDTVAAAADKLPTTLPSKVPNVILPDPSDEEEQDIRQPTQSLPRPSHTEATPADETPAVDDEDPFRDDVGQHVDPEPAASEEQAVEVLPDSSEGGMPSAALEGAAWPVGQLRPARYEGTVPSNAQSVSHQRVRHAPAGRSPFASVGGNPLRRSGATVQRASAVETWGPEPLAVAEPSGREPHVRNRPTARPLGSSTPKTTLPRSAPNPLRVDG